MHLLLVCLTALASQVVFAVPLPSDSSCAEAYGKIGQDALLSRLSSCQSSITAECCAAGAPDVHTNGYGSNHLKCQASRQ